MDYFDPMADPGLNLRAVADAGTRFLLISFDTDWRFSSEHSAQLAQDLIRDGLDAEHVEIESPWGHDSFLMDVPEYHRRLSLFIGDRSQEIARAS